MFRQGEDERRDDSFVSTRSLSIINSEEIKFFNKSILVLKLNIYHLNVMESLFSFSTCRDAL